MFLDRIDEYSKNYNAFIYINNDAIDIEKKLDIEYENSGLRSNLMGMPIIIKDNIDVYAMST